MKLVKETSAKLQITQDMLKRPLNVGFSGGKELALELEERGYADYVSEAA
jgi:Fe-S cluster assembly ATP-binding protein